MKREFDFSDKDFDYIRNTVTAKSGIVLQEHKKNMIYGRLTKRLRELKMKSFTEYCELIKNSNDEMITCINAITTNLTYFFRENHHFEFLKNSGFPEVLSRKNKNEISIWCSASSTGEEPYSLAYTAYYNLPKGCKVNLLASDIDHNVLEKAKAGVYDIDTTEKLDLSVKKKMFLRGKNENKNKVMVFPELKEMVDFKIINLLDDWNFNRKFDIIFCRNVLIYFDKPTQNKIFQKFYNSLNDYGFLCIGHSEKIPNEFNFQLLSHSTYLKNKGGE